MDVNIGDVFYKIEATRSQGYHNTCRICDGTRKLSVRGFEFKCPACEKEETVLNVYGYFVRRYRLFSIEHFTRDDDWTASDARYVKYRFYHKSGRGYSFYSGTHKNISMRKEQFEEYLNKTDFSERQFDEVIFSDYKLAVQQAERLTQINIEKVREFNVKHGTDYPMPDFNIVHDKKSR